MIPEHDDDDFELRLRELTEDPTMRELALELLSDSDRQRVLEMEAAALGPDPSPERLQRIYHTAMRRVRWQDAMASMRRLGLRVLDATAELASQFSRWLLERIADTQRMPAAAHFGADAAERPKVKIVIEDLDHQEIELIAEVEESRWRGKGEAHLVVLAPPDLARYRGWERSLCMVVVPEHRSSWPCEPVATEQTAQHCRLTFDLRFPTRKSPDGRDGKGLPAPVHLWVEQVRLFPTPW